jgi:hypothetical protein
MLAATLATAMLVGRPAAAADLTFLDHGHPVLDARCAV